MALPEISPATMKRAHFWLAVFFALQIPFDGIRGLRESVPYLVFLSQWALVAAHLAGYQGVRAEQSEK